MRVAEDVTLVPGEKTIFAISTADTAQDPAGDQETENDDANEGDVVDGLMEHIMVSSQRGGTR